MFESIIALVTRGVVALETIAAYYKTAGANVAPAEVTKTVKEEAQKEEAKETKGEETEQQGTTEPTGSKGGRRSRGNKGGDNKGTEEDTAGAGKGRRSRSAKQDPVCDTEEQAAQRAQLVIDLQDLADVEEAHGEVQEALQRVGAENITKVASASLDDFAADIAALIGKYFD